MFALIYTRKQSIMFAKRAIIAHTCKFMTSALGVNAIFTSNLGTNTTTEESWKVVKKGNS